MYSNLYLTNSKPNAMPPWNELLPSPDNSRPSWLLETLMNTLSNHYKLPHPKTKRKSPLYALPPMISAVKSKVYFVN
jgi:hypothetical protein